MEISSRIVAILLAVFLILFIPSLSRLYVNPYQFDEAYSIYIARNGWSDMESLLLNGADTHPPLYNNVLKLWISPSTSYAWVKLSSILAALGAIFVIYLICIENFNEKVGLFSVSIIATSQFFISIAGMVCMYTLYLLLSALSMYYYLKILRKPEGRTVLYYTATTVLGMYTHWFFAYVLLTEMLYYIWEKRNLKEFAKVYLPVGLLCVPLMPFLSSQLNVLKYASTEILSIWVGKVTVGTLANFYTELTTTEISGLLILAALIGSYMADKIIISGRKPAKIKISKDILFFLALMLVPVILAVAIDHLTNWNLFVDRHFTFMLIPFSITVSYFVANSHSKALAAILAIAVAYNALNIMADTYQQAKINAIEKPDEIATYAKYDVILHMSAFTYFPSTAYDWEHKGKHLIIYDDTIEKNRLLDYALKSGVINESNIIRNCDILRGRKVALKDSNSWVASESIKELWRKCYPKDSKYLKELPVLIYPVAKTSKITNTTE